MLSNQFSSDRYHSLSAFLAAGRIPAALTASELNALAGRPNEAWRPSIIPLLAKQLRGGLSSADVLSLLGEIGGGDRYNMLSALVSLNAINPLSTVDLATLTATFGAWSASATSLLANLQSK